MEVPNKLKSKDFRFIKLRGKTKQPLEKAWTNGKNYTYEEIQEWTKDGNNYGVATGIGSLGVIDCDLEILDERVRKLLPPTLTVETGSGGIHHYYIIKDLDKKFIFYYKGTIHAGELQWEGQQVVGAGSIHPDTKKPYRVKNNKPIAEITQAELEPLFAEFKKQKKSKKKSKSSTSSHKGFCLPITQVIEKVPELQEFERKGKDLQGSHPVHGSSTKINFCIDDESDIWHCFRCGTGGDTLDLIAMLEGIIKCEDVGSEPLSGKEFKKVLKLAKDKYGFDEEELVQKELPEEPKSLKDVHDTFKKYLYLEDLKPIDLALAIALSKQKKGTPIWTIFIGASSGGKSAILRSLEEVPGTMLKDDITENTLASGAKDKDGKPVSDLGMKLQGKSTLIVTPDLASLSSHNRDAKRRIWAKFRELFDGYISKDTGNEVSRDYKDCHVTWIFGATPSIRSEVLIYAELGTRELMYELKLPNNIDDIVMEKAWSNENYEEEMKKALRDVVRKFAKCHDYDENIKVSEKMKEFIKSEAKRLEYLRATAPIDRSGELLANVVPAKPYRSMKQFKKIYLALKSLDPQFDDERAKEIIRNIVDSTSNPVRTGIMYIHENDIEGKYTFQDYKKMLKVSRYMVKCQAMTLWNIGYLERVTETKTVAGKLEEVEYFQKNKDETFQFVR